MNRQMTNVALQNALKTMFKNEGMKQIILAAIEISKEDKLTRREKKQLLNIEKLTNQL
ncbi:hypothetical protein [Staphylococcus caprae]|uniref:hypothetical protein n=1 Tax=Staphylococcus caprae TaxID=29380 RepID=UPI0015F865F2|nr:hypothetical protein [Staphylococcus caprae]